MRPIVKRNNMVFVSYKSPRDCNCPSVNPARTDMIEAGMRPKRVARRNVWYGMPTMGDAKLMKVFGKVGVTRKKSM